MKNIRKLNKSELFGSIVKIIFDLIRRENHKLVINTKYKFNDVDFADYVKIKQDYESANHVNDCWKSNIDCSACMYHTITKYSVLLFNLYINYVITSSDIIKQTIFETISDILFGDRYKNTNKTEKEMIKESFEMILEAGKKYKIL